MLVRRVLCLFIPLSIFMLTACDDSSNARAPEMIQEAKQDTKQEQKFEKTLKNSFQGIIDERTSLRPISISLEQQGNQITGTLRVGETSERSILSLPTDKGIAVEGDFNTKTAVAKFTTQTGQETREIITEIAQTEEGALATFFREGRHGSKGARIAEAVFPSSENAKNLGHIIKTLSGLKQNKPENIEGACPKEVQIWIDVTDEMRKASKYSYQILKAFDIPEFKNAIGKKHENVDAPTLMKTAGILRGSCIQNDRKKSQHVLQLSHMLIDPKTYKETYYRAIGKRVSEVWAQNITDLISSDAILSDQEIAQIKAQWHSFGLGSYGLDFRKLSPQIQRRKKENKERELRLSRLDLMEQYKDRFDLLYMTALAQIAEYPDTKGLVQEKLKEHLVPASHEYATNAKYPKQLTYMLSWSKNVKNGTPCLLPSGSDCKTIAETFDKGSTQLAEALSSKLSKYVESKGLNTKNTTLDDLAQSVKIAERIRFKYRDGLEVGALANEWAKITKQRQNVQKSLYKALYNMINEEDNAQKIVQFEKTYFLENDLKQYAVQKIDRLLTEKLKSHAPFRNLPSGEYLNALVSKDWESLQKMDNEYTQGFKPFLALAGQAMSRITPSAQQGFDQMAQNMSAVNAAFATYLLEYQTPYKSCLGANPVEARVSKTTTQITKSGYGFEISRTSWTTEDYYKIPQRLAPHFERLWRSDFRQGGPLLSDALFNDSRISSLVASIKNVMKNYKCDDPSVKALEDGMIRYYLRTSQ